ncbi:hypothetical protein GW765_00415 [Candidatus Parcubacteria bacterium]|nr:hypothetical protein [Candidatus Parcubacteria bacterium]
MYLKQSHKIGMFLALLFIICFFWFYVNQAEQGLHMALFRMSYIGFQDMNFLGFILGLIQSYIWGYVAIGAWQLTEKFSAK